MKRIMLKSKIHRARVTQADLEYEGSIAIDETLLAAADILPFEKVAVWNVTNGQRFETYAIPEKKDSGCICVNGAAARLVNAGDLIIVMCFGYCTPEEARTLVPRIVLVDAANRIAHNL